MKSECFKMPVRVLQVVTSMDVGGIETMLMNLYRNVDRSKVQFDFLFHRNEQSYYDEEIINLGGKIYNVEPARASRLHRYMGSLNDFFSETCQHKIVHSHVSIISFFVLREALKQGVPFRIAHSHEAHKSLREHRLLRQPLVMTLKPLVNRVCNFRFGCGVDAGRWLFGPDEGFHVLKNAIDSKRYVFDRAVRGALRGELKIGDRFCVGHIGNFTSPKNYPFILKTFKAILERNSDAVLVLVGKNENDPTVAEQAARLGIDKNIIFTGIRSDVPQLLQAMDVFLFPSTFEGLPVAVIEAQAAGLPTLISDAVDSEVKITPDLEFKSLSESPEIWAEKVLEMGDRSKRHDRSQLVVDAGYDIKSNAEWLTNFYLELAESAAGAGLTS